MPILRSPSSGAAGARRLAVATFFIALCELAGCASSAAVYGARAATADSLARAVIAREKSLNVADIPENTLSVAPLAVLSSDTAYASLGYGVAALLVNDLGRSARLTLVERLKIDAILHELDLGQSGLVDTATASKVGKLVGARHMVIGSIDLRSSGNLRIDSHVANIATGRISPAATGSGTLTQLFDAEKTIALRLFDVLGVTLTPSERRAVDRRATRNINAFLAFSRGVKFEASRNFTAASSSYALALRLDPAFSAAGQRLSTLQSGSVSTISSEPVVGRAATISTDLVNRPAPVVIGTAADAPVASRQSLITFVIKVSTP